MNGQMVAGTTAQQLGGYRMLEIMIGAKQFTYDSAGTLRFKFKGSRKANFVEIKLNGLDLYDVKISKLVTKNYIIEEKVVKEFTNVYNDQLKSLFEETTGLYLSLV